MQQNHYVVLNISPGATPSEVRDAYRKQIRLWHPDVNDSSDADTRTKNINLAYEVLSDSVSRKIFDIELEGIVESECAGVDVASMPPRHYRGVYSEAKRNHEGVSRNEKS